MRRFIFYIYVNMNGYIGPYTGGKLQKRKRTKRTKREKKMR